MAGMGFFVSMLLVGFAARILSMIMLAVTGKPLLYDVKTTISQDGSGKSFSPRRDRPFWGSSCDKQRCKSTPTRGRQWTGMESVWR